MRGIIRLIDGLARGDMEAVYVLAFAVVGTVILVAIAEVVQRRRRQVK